MGVDSKKYAWQSTECQVQWIFQRAKIQLEYCRQQSTKFHKKKISCTIIQLTMYGMNELNL